MQSTRENRRFSCLEKVSEDFFHGQRIEHSSGLAMKSGSVARVWPRASDRGRFTGLDAAPSAGNTFGMKTAVSIPDDVFADAERLASRLQTSRSKLYARALAEFVARHDDDRVTALMDEAVREAGGQLDAFVGAAARQSMRRADW